MHVKVASARGGHSCPIAAAQCVMEENRAQTKEPQKLCDAFVSFSLWYRAITPNTRTQTLAHITHTYTSFNTTPHAQSVAVHSSKLNVHNPPSKNHLLSACTTTYTTAVKPRREHKRLALGEQGAPRYK